MSFKFDLQTFAYTNDGDKYKFIDDESMVISADIGMRPYFYMAWMLENIEDHFVNEVIRATLFYIFTIYFEYQNRNLSLDDNGLKRLKNVYGNLDGKMISSFMDTKDFKNFYSTVLF